MFCSILQFIDPQGNPLRFSENGVLAKYTFSYGSARCPFWWSRKTLCFVAFFSLLIPLRFSENGVLSKYPFSQWFCKMLISVILKTLRFVELLGLVVSRPTPTISRKQRFGKIHSIGNLLVWPAPDSLMPYFLGIFADLAFQPGLLW